MSKTLADFQPSKRYVLLMTCGRAMSNRVERDSPAQIRVRSGINLLPSSYGSTPDLTRIPERLELSEIYDEQKATFWVGSEELWEIYVQYSGGNQIMETTHTVAQVV